MSEEFEFHTYDAPFSVGPFVIHAFAVDHPVEAYGMRITVETDEGRRTFAYSGDTGPTPALIDIAGDADLFLCEASFRARRRQPAQPAPHRHRVAARPPPRSGDWCHHGAWHDSRHVPRAGYDGPTELAQPRRVRGLDRSGARYRASLRCPGRSTRVVRNAAEPG